MDNGIFITGNRLSSLSKAEQTYLFGLVIGSETPIPDVVMSPPLSPHDHSAQSERDDDFAELSPRQARDFYLGCGEKTKKAVEGIARSKSPTFQVADIAIAVGVEAADLRGVWGGLTRRTQTVVGEGAYLIHWHDGTQKYDEKGSYVDQIGEVTEMTYHSFRKALKL